MQWPHSRNKLVGVYNIGTYSKLLTISDVGTAVSPSHHHLKLVQNILTFQPFY